MSDLRETIKENAAMPASAAVSPGSTSVAQQDLEKLIKADKHLAEQKALEESPTVGITFVKFIPPGA